MPGVDKICPEMLTGQMEREMDSSKTGGAPDRLGEEGV